MLARELRAGRAQTRRTEQKNAQGKVLHGIDRRDSAAVSPGKRPCHRRGGTDAAKRPDNNTAGQHRTNRPHAPSDGTSAACGHDDYLVVNPDRQDDAESQDRRAMVADQLTRRRATTESQVCRTSLARSGQLPTTILGRLWLLPGEPPRPYKGAGAELQRETIIAPKAEGATPP